MDIRATAQKIIKDMATEINGLDFDVTRILTIAGVLVFFGCSAYALVRGQPFNPTDYGLGLTTIIFGGSAGIKLKESTERKVEWFSTKRKFENQQKMFL